MQSAPSKVTFDNAAEAIEPLARALAADGWALDLASCAEFDSSLIGVLLELERTAKARGAKCSFSNPPPNLLELARLYGVRELLFVDRN